MAPNQFIVATTPRPVTEAEKTTDITQQNKEKSEKDYVYKLDLVWTNVIICSYLHLGALYGLYLLLSGQAYLATFLFACLYGWASATGVTAGSHRLWAHKAYKARWPLRLILAYFQTAAFQNHIYEWVRDHRVHHKFCDTNADPHNSKRGFFFCHVGWLLVRKHKDVKLKGKTIDMSDLEKDWVVMLQKKHFSWLMPLCCFVIPSVIPWYFWGENGWTSYWVAGIMRYVLVLNGTWLVNSAAHMWGDRPYDKNITATNNWFVGVFGVGEGWHNYHHAFPWDYKASELWNINSTTTVINMFAKIGWAYELKEASDEMIRRRAIRVGDGSSVQAISKGEIYSKQSKEINHHEGEFWGYDDKDITEEQRAQIMIKNKHV